MRLKRWWRAFCSFQRHGCESASDTVVVFSAGFRTRCFTRGQKTRLESRVSSISGGIRSAHSKGKRDHDGEPNARPVDEERGQSAVPIRTPLARSSSSVSIALDSMTTRFHLSEVPAIAARYSSPDEPSVIAIVPAVRRQGHLTKDQLFTLCRWKSPRSAGRVRRNSAAFVEEITRFALSATDERARIEPLTLLDGVDYPTASCILHWFHTDPYPIVDFRAIWSLQLSQTPPYSFDFWQSYFTGWRELLAKARRVSANVTPRLFDQALWQYSNENQRT